MSAPVPPTPDPTPAPTAPSSEPPKAEMAQAGHEPEAPKPTETVEFWKQQARANEEKFKANAAAALRLKEIEDRDLSELQKAQRDREEAVTEARAARTESLRWRIAASHGISPEDAELFLTGADEAAMTAQAARLAAKQAAPASRPELTPDPSMGARGGGGVNPRQLFADILKSA